MSLEATMALRSDFIAAEVAGEGTFLNSLISANYMLLLFRASKYHLVILIFVSKQVICLATDKFLPEKKPVWSADKTMFFYYGFTPTGIVVQL